MSFQQGLSGLNVSSKALDIISNNVANTNTVGFKSGSAIFADVYAASLTGSVSGKQVGAGGTLASVRQTFSQGNMTTTNNPLDMAINGDGFFILGRTDGPDIYSRNGQFELDRSGFIITATGERLKGYQSPTVPGQLPSPVGVVKEIQIPIRGSDAQVTNSVVIGGNLDANALSPAETYPTLTSPEFPRPESADWRDPRTYNFSTSIEMYDSLGKSHELTYYFVKENVSLGGAANTWNVHVSLDGGYPLGFDPLTGDPVADPPPASWALTFDQNGRLGDGTDPLVPAPVGPDAASPFTDPLIFTPDALPISLYTDFSNMRQIGAPYLVSELSQNGFTGGELAGLSIDRDGIITGRYTNGETVALAQLALQTFRNPNGLNAIGNNFWEATLESGVDGAVSKPGEGVAGVISAGMVEDANVELTTELVQMIIQQRNYQANAQSIKAQDQILQTLVNLR